MAGGARFEPNDYYCEDCDYKFEEFQLIAERDSAECPRCKRMAPRIISVHSGWMECVDGLKAQVERDVKEMQKKINKKDEKFVSNFRGPEGWEK